MDSKENDQPTPPFDKALSDILKENPKLLEEFWASGIGVEIRERINRFSEVIRTGIVDEELCKSQALKMLEMEATIPGTYEPLYFAIAALIKEHGEEAGARIAQERWAKQQERTFYHITELLRSFKR